MLGNSLGESILEAPQKGEKYQQVNKKGGEEPAAVAVDE